MRRLLVLLVLVAVTGGAENPKSTPEKKDSSKTLRVGDPAPALKASKWLQGEEVRQFEPGIVYVVEFWATWCGPCLRVMPDLAELQAQYKNQGVTCIGYTSRDPNNTEEKVAAFVKKRGPKLNYTFAYADDPTTLDAWMTAAGRDGIPCAFVVDKIGRIAYIGDPMYLGVVLPKVVAGNMKAQAVGDEVGKIKQEFLAANEAHFPDHTASLQALKEFEAKYPPLAHNPLIIVRIKLNLLPKVGEVDEARKVAEDAVVKAIKQDNLSALMQVAAQLRNCPGKESNELIALAVKAAKAAVQIAGDKDARALIELASTYFAAGDKAKAREYARKAVEAAAGESAALKQDIEQQSRMFDNGKQ